MNDLTEKINNILLKDKLSSDDFEEISTLFVKEDGEIKKEEVFIAQQHISELLFRFKFISKVLKEIYEASQSQSQTVIEQSDEYKDVKIYKANVLGIPIEKIYEVLFDKKTIED